MMERKSILIVEDDLDLAFAFEKVLTKAGFAVNTAGDGKLAQMYSGESNYDLILLDVILPDCSGLDLIAGFKANPANPYVFVVLMSAEAISSEDKSAGLNIGADGYLTKPIQNKELLAAVNAFLRHKDTIDLLLVKEKELIAARVIAESSEKMKSFFLANMSHEIRTPLNAIIGFSELIEDEEISNETRVRYSNLIRKNGDSLLHLLSDILDLSMFESGEIKLWNQKFDLAEMLNDLKSVYENRIKEDKPGMINIQCVLDQLSDPVIFSDIQRIKQVISNLLDNAVKFTSQGSVVIKADDLTRDMITISITDSGLGIEPSQIDYIFKPFGRIELSRTRPIKGTGLGLAIVNRIVASLKGDIAVTSIPGKGSKFTVRICRFMDEDNDL